MAGRTSYYGGIALDGLVFHIDAAKQESYAKRGLRYMQAGNNNLFIDFADTSKSPSNKNATGSVINGATFSNFAPYHLTAYYSQFWHNPLESAWKDSAGVGTFYGNIEFDGVDDYVSFSATPDLNTTDITVSAWFYVNKFRPSLPSGGTVSIIASRYNNLSNGWELAYNNNGVVWFGGKEIPAQYIYVTASILAKETNMGIVGTANGGWYNAVGIKKGNNWSISVAETNCFRHVSNIAEVRKTDLKHLQPNTVQIGTGTVPFGTNNLVLGKASNANDSYMNGRLMNLSIYNRALSLAEINQNFDSFSKRIIDIEGIAPLVLTCNSSVVPPTVINGITITESYSGSVTTYTNPFTCCGGSVVLPGNSKWLGSSGPFSYTMTFSSAVNNIIIFLAAAGQYVNENFIITTNTGIPSITSNVNCYTTIVGNEILSGLNADPDGGGGGKFFISNSLPFTTLTITGNGGESGSLLAICDSVGTPLPEFITKWDTNIATTGLAKTIEIPINTSYTYNYTVDWGDGITTTGHTGNATHTYTTNGIYTVKVTGNFPAIATGNSIYNVRMTEVSQWGTGMWRTMNGAFSGCKNMDVTATDSPNLSLATDMSFMFYRCEKMNGTIGNWNTSTITNMTRVFWFCTLFNRPLNWDTSIVATMDGMFESATAFDRPLNSWNVGNVQKMNSMFRFAAAFNQPLNSWNTAYVDDMNNMFAYASLFNQNISSWNTARVTNMSGMFSNAIAFNNGGAAGTSPMATVGNSWNTENVLDMNNMFVSAYAFNQNIGNWNTAKVTKMYAMFASAIVFNNGGVAGSSTNPMATIGTSWNTAMVDNMSGMFNNARAFNQNISSWNTARVTNMSSMFYNAFTFNNGGSPMPRNGSSWDTSLVQNMNAMFSGDQFGYNVFNQNIGNWQVGNVLDFREFMGKKTPATLSAANLDAIYNGWSAQTVKPNLTPGVTNISFGTAKRTTASTAGKNILTTTYAWTIVDGGL